MIKYMLSLLLGIMLFADCAANGDIESSAKDANNIYTNPIIKTSLPDPTVIKAGDGFFYLYATEDIRNVPIYKSKDLVKWTYTGTAFSNATRPTFVEKGGIWAPDINYINGKYVLYYAMSVWGGEWTCGIGVAISDHPEGPFKDLGKLFISSEIGVKNSIDEYFISDNGHNYLFWGSFRGIYGIELSQDGLSIKPGAEKKQIAGNMMEATCILKRNGYYYLFGSHGFCCDGLKSTYKLTIGRSRNLFGPYLTRDGKSLLADAYDVFLHKNDKFVGTGHNSEIITDDKQQDWIIYHAYMVSDPDAGRTVMLDQLKWSNGWPYVDNDSPSSSHAAPYFIKH